MKTLVAYGKRTQRTYRIHFVRGWLQTSVDVDASNGKAACEFVRELFEGASIAFVESL
jgi:hypothetical protein